MANILEEVQTYVADKLNADSQLSGLCTFLVENRKDIDFQIKNALGRQGVCGLVMTPKATYAGSFEDKSLAWQIDELEVDIVENVTVNRGKKEGYVTGQDASMRLFDVMCPLSGEGEGQFNPVSYQEGEDGNLLVNKCILKCLVHKDPPPDPALTRFYYEDGSVEEKDIVGSLIRSGFQSNGLTKVEVGTHVDTIGNSAFNGIATLQDVVLPTTLSAIESNAFLSCMGLSSINLPEGLKTTGDSCFKSCTSLTSIRIPSTVEHMGQQTFKSCTSLSSAYFEDGLSDIANQTFAYCSQLVDVRIPDTATRIGEQVFLRCTGLQTIRFDDSVVDTLDMNAFNGCTSLSAVYGPGSLTSLKFGVFLDCTSLKTFNNTGEVYLYDGLEEMGSRVFSNSGVEKVSFPNWSAMGISNYAFTGCSTLTDVVVRGVTTHEAMSLENYPWGISNESIIRGDRGV